MRVRVGGPTDLRLSSGRPFSVARACEVDLDKLGLSDADQQELASKHWIEPLDEAAEVDATDAARELAEEHGIDLAEVGGTGADGRIVIGDIRALIDDEG